MVIVSPMAHRLVTERLALRPWSIDDAGAALGAYGDAEVARWLTPAMDRINDLAAMRVVLEQWVAEDARMITPAGRWAIELRQDGRVIGGATLLPLSPDEEFEVGWQLHREAWGHGYATEAARAVIDRGFALGLPEVYAVVRPGNEASMAVCRRLGMLPLGRLRRWYDVELEAFRLLAPVVVE